VITVTSDTKTVVLELNSQQQDSLGRIMILMTQAMRSRKRDRKEQADLSSTKRARHAARISFLDLPRELRDIIYELSLVSTETIDVCQLATPLRNAKKLGISTALLRVSRQIHHEALEVIYGLNTFEAKILLDPRVPHAYDHDPGLRDSWESCTFDNPMVNKVKRLIIHLDFVTLSLLPDQNPSFPAEVLRAFVLGGSLDIILLQPGSFSSYMKSLQCYNALLATANAALAVMWGSLFSRCLLSCVDARDNGTRVVYTPQSRVPLGFLEFPWVTLRLDSHSTATATASEMSCHLPLRFRSSGQTDLAGSMGD
jgi:hypothetical protein